MYNFKIVIFSWLLFCVTGFSQNTLSGKIINQNNKPLSGTHIHIGKKIISTDEYGNYTIKKVTNGNIKIHVSYLGYQSIDTIVVVNSDMLLDFTLKENKEILQEVLIKQSQNTVTKSVLEQKIKLETIEKYSNQSLGDVLREVSGVSSLKTGNAIVKPIINGLYGSRIPIINNNVRLEDQEWGTEHAPNFDVNSAGKITVIKGASGLQYSGDAVGGLVILEPLSVKIDSLFGKTIVNFDSNGRGGSVTSSLHKGNLNGWSWNTTGTLKYIGDREAPNYVLSNTGNREYNFSGDIKYSSKKFEFTSFYSFYKSKIGILSASHIGNVNDLYNSITNKIPSVVNDFTYSIQNPRQEVQHHIGKASFNYIFNETTNLFVQYAFQMNKRLEFDIRRGADKDRPALNLELKTHSVMIDFKRILHDWSFKTGVATAFQTNFANPSTGIYPLIPDFNKYDFGLYGIVSHQFSETFSVDTGLRFDFTSINASKYYLKSRWNERNYNAKFSNIIVGDFTERWLTEPKFDFQNVSASIGFLKAFEKDLKWFTNISMASRNPNVSELFSDGLHHSTGVIELGDLSLKREQSVKLSTTLLKKWTSFYLEVNPYVSSINNFMFLKPTGFETTIRGAFPVWEYEQTNARLLGIDVQTRWNVSKNWMHFLNLGYVNGKDITPNQPLIDMPPLNLNTKIQYSKPEWNSLVLELKADVVFNQNQFPNNNFTTNIVVNGNLLPVLVDVSTPPGSYQLLHFHSEMRLKTFKSGFATLGFSVQNIFNTEYRDYLNRQRLFASEMGRNLQIQLKINY